MRRRVLSALAIGACAVLAASCGASADETSTKRATPARAPKVFDVAAAEIAASDTALFVRGGDSQIDRVERSIRATAGGRVILNELPRRTALAKLGLERLGFAPQIAGSLAPLVRTDVVVANRRGGWSLWVVLHGEDAKLGKELAEQYSDIASLEDSVLRIGTSERAFAGQGAAPGGSPALAEVERWEHLARSKAGRAAFVIGVDRGRMLAVRADSAGFVASGRTGGGRSCAPTTDSAIDALGAVASGVALAAASTASDGTGAGSLRDLLDVSTTTVRAVGQIDVGAGRVARMRDALVAGASALTTRMVVPELASSAVGVVDAGGRQPRVVAPAASSAPTLADDQRFTATREAAGDPASDHAAWIDIDTAIQAAAEAGLTGIERSVASSLGAGIDGILAWSTCGGRIGARLAVADT